jgi:hypothetical protein
LYLIKLRVDDDDDDDDGAIADFKFDAGFVQNDRGTQSFCSFRTNPGIQVHPTSHLAAPPQIGNGVAQLG